MRSSILAAAPFAAAVSAQALTTITGRVQTATISQSGSALYTRQTARAYVNVIGQSTYVREMTSGTFLRAVVTGIPSNTAVAAGTQPAVVTSQPEVATIPAGLASQPEVATIPAGLPTGQTYIQINGTAGFTSFQVSVGPSTTIVNGGSASVATSGAAASGSGSSSSGGSGGSGSNSGSGSSDSDASSSDSAASASASESGNAASSVRVAGAGIGLFAFIAALL